jgi:hypothetical protein
MNEFQHRIAKQERVLAVVEPPRHFVKVGRQMPRGDPMPSSLPSPTSVKSITDTQSAMRDNGNGLNAGAR